MLAPVHKLKKTEIIWLNRHRCNAHRMPYLSHYNCYLKEHPNAQEKVGFIDIETSNLDANFGVMFCYCILDNDSGKILKRTVTKKELIKCLDKKVVEQCVRDINKFDKLIGFYSTKFDIPFIRTRAAYWGLDFPSYGEINHTDVYYIIRNKFKLHSNRLDNACRVILGKTQKTYLDSQHWIKAHQGDKESLDYILKHCEYDVIDLKKLYVAVENYKRPSSVSM